MWEDVLTITYISTQALGTLAIPMWFLIYVPITNVTIQADNYFEIILLDSQAAWWLSG